MKPLLRLLLVCAACTAAAPTVAQEKRPSSSDASVDMMMDLFHCSEIAEPDQRLACFDRETAELKIVQGREGLVVMDREDIQQARRGLFGFDLPRVPIFSRDDDKDDEVREVETVISSFTFDASGKARFTTETGAVWLQTDSVPVLGRVETGDAVTIKRAALGSYKAKIESRRAFRVERVK